MQGVSVVVPTYDRSDLLPELIAALQAQTHPDFDVAIVDNGSSDGTRELLRELTAGDERFRVLHVEENRGPARARNLGWRATDRDQVAFTDDDCLPEPAWLEELVAGAGARRIVQGRTVPMDDSPRGWFDRTQRVERWSGRYETCNLLVPREVLQELGGFDERYPVAMGEDTDLGLRAKTAGVATAFEGAAVVRHHVWPGGFADFLRHRRRHAELVQLFRRHPEARGLLLGGVAVRASHLVVWGVVLTSVAVPWTGAWLLPVAMPFAWSGLNTWRSRRRPVPWWGRFGHSLLQFTGYAYETVCFAVASVRYRTVVL